MRPLAGFNLGVWVTVTSANIPTLQGGSTLSVVKKSLIGILAGVLLLFIGCAAMVSVFYVLGDTQDDTAPESQSPTLNPTPELTAGPTRRPTPKWYQGGSLHQKTAAEWVKASERNRLATSADFATTALKGSTVLDRMNSADDLRPYAVDIKKCIDAAYHPHPPDPTVRNAQTAAFCWVLTYPNLR